MIAFTEETVKGAEIFITVSCISIGGLVLICKVVICETIDALFDIKERRLERREKIEKKKGATG